MHVSVIVCSAGRIPAHTEPSLVLEGRSVLLHPCLLPDAVLGLGDLLQVAVQPTGVRRAGQVAQRRRETLNHEEVEHLPQRVGGSGSAERPQDERTNKRGHRDMLEVELSGRVIKMKGKVKK